LIISEEHLKWDFDLGLLIHTSSVISKLY
jgi:hypothetical protein